MTLLLIGCANLCGKKLPRGRAAAPRRCDWEGSGANFSDIDFGGELDICSADKFCISRLRGVKTGGRWSRTRAVHRCAVIWILYVDAVQVCNTTAVEQLVSYYGTLVLRYDTVVLHHGTADYFIDWLLFNDVCCTHMCVWCMVTWWFLELCKFKAVVAASSDELRRLWCHLVCCWNHDEQDRLYLCRVWIKGFCHFLWTCSRRGQGPDQVGSYFLDWYTAR